MPTLGLAGGTSPSLGRAIVTALFSAPHGPQWKIVILSRSRHRPLWLRAVDPEELRVQIRTADYLSVESVAGALKGVDTLISVTSALDGSQRQVQLNLLHAAVKAGCARFAPSQWGFGPTGLEAVSATKGAVEGVWEECMRFQDKIECTRFNHGSYMNYLGHGIFPNPEPPLPEDKQLIRLQEGGGYAKGEDEACQGLHRQGDMKDGSGAFLISLKNGIAELPQTDDGKWPRITLTTMRDVGRFVAYSLELPRWEPSMTMVGETLTMGELLTHAEAVAKRKLDVTVVNSKSLERKLKSVSSDDFMAWLWVELKLAYCRDRLDEGYLEPVVNRLCPEVKPTSVKEYLQSHWMDAD
ncbi:NmrA-like family protein [Aspergillus novofumigatus IBT 16806]|uniref:NmrA-like family protein n=1 Tax=Aspergillus novofumigatus (strain IBT 16806) TaxID=1392255 RepID=A0A2I1C448_ASPN1|nr:NmrA-like family protein [Aspergillus novofumigatus IBT 16806]PKX92407.1 NmrA-like family protein [Aspergillus novofumigatus IBT 16806]